MLTGLDPLVLAQMAVGAVADIAFAIALGATLLRFGAASRALTMRTSLLVWHVAQLVYLVLQASSMSGEPLSAAGSAIGAVLTQSHFGRMWILGIGTGALATLLALFAERGQPVAGTWGSVVRLVLLCFFFVMAFAHAGATHAADAGDFSAAEWTHAVHLWTTGAWAGVVISSAWPMRRVFRPWSTQTLHDLRHLSLMATLTFLFAIATGLTNAWRGLGGSLAPLKTSLWGELLTAKLVVVGVVVVIGAINRLAHLAHRRAIDRTTLRVFLRLLSAEAVLMVGVLIAASVLGHCMPAALG